MAYGLLIAMGVMALVFVAITRRAAQPPAVTEVNPAVEAASAPSWAATVPTAAAVGTVAAAIRTAVRMAMCDIFATMANWPSCEAGSTSVGLASSRTTLEGETLHYLWLVENGLMVRCFCTVNPTFSFVEGDWGLTQSPRVRALTEEIGAYQASISSEGAVELPQQLHSDIIRLLTEEVNAA